MPAAPELTKEEQELFEQMQKDEGPPAKDDDGAKDAAAKVEADKAAKEAADKTAKDAADKESKKQEMAPKAALDEERVRNKELRKEIETMKNLVSEGDKKLQKFMESVAKKAEVDAGPKFEDDPAGALKHENETLKSQITEINAKLAKQEEAGDSQTKMQQFASFVTAREKEFAKANPDYFQAADYVAEVWRDEFREAGFKEEDLPKMVFGKSLAVTNQATKAEKDPAEAIYKIAKRFGFAAKQQSETKKEEAKGDEKTDAKSKLEQIARGVEASKSAGGGTGPDDTSFASLAQMDDEQIEKLVADKDWWAKNIRRSALH